MGGAFDPLDDRRSTGQPKTNPITGLTREPSAAERKFFEKNAPLGDTFEAAFELIRNPKTTDGLFSQARQFIADHPYLGGDNLADRLYAVIVDLPNSEARYRHRKLLASDLAELPHGLEHLERLMGSPEPQDRRIALHAIAKHPSESAVTHVLKALKDPKLKTRAWEKLFNNDGGAATSLLDFAMQLDSQPDILRQLLDASFQVHPRVAVSALDPGFKYYQAVRQFFLDHMSDDLRNYLIAGARNPESDQYKKFRLLLWVPNAEAKTACAEIFETSHSQISDGGINLRAALDSRALKQNPNPELTNICVRMLRGEIDCTPEERYSAAVALVDDSPENHHQLLCQVFAREGETSGTYNEIGRYLKDKRDTDTFNAVTSALNPPRTIGHWISLPFKAIKSALLSNWRVARTPQDSRMENALPIVNSMPEPQRRHLLRIIQRNAERLLAARATVLRDPEAPSTERLLLTKIPSTELGNVFATCTAQVSNVLMKSRHPMASTRLATLANSHETIDSTSGRVKFIRQIFVTRITSASDAMMAGKIFRCPELDTLLRSPSERMLSNFSLPILQELAENLHLKSPLRAKIVTALEGFQRVTSGQAREAAGQLLSLYQNTTTY